MVFKKNKSNVEVEKPKEKSKKKSSNTIPTNGLWGIALLFISVSILYANYRVFFGTEDTISRLMLLPSTLAVITFLVCKSAK